MSMSLGTGVWMASSGVYFWSDMSAAADAEAKAPAKGGGANSRGEASKRRLLGSAAVRKRLRKSREAMVLKRAQLMAHVPASVP